MIKGEDSKKEAAHTNPHEDLEDKPEIPTFEVWVKGLKYDKQWGYIDEFFDTMKLEDILDVVQGWTNRSDGEMFVMTVIELKEGCNFFEMQDDDFVEFMNKAYREEFGLEF
ncbi:MAG: hypothetical protein KAS32_30590 [Candidatus Peribacteraceae bacterium]|nr:hypothetical protein [Candidatus Peribacteraceae bacterium]